jgi:hypothetical protein
VALVAELGDEDHAEAEKKRFQDILRDVAADGPAFDSHSRLSSGGVDVEGLVRPRARAR